jgi:hypothetical protein
MAGEHSLIAKQRTGKRRDEEIEKLLKDAESEYPDLLERYSLWGEFLKRSKTFKRVCLWFEKAREEYPYPDDIRKHKLKPQYLEDYFFFADTYERVRSPLLPLKTYSIPIVTAMRSGIAIMRDALSGTFFSWAVDAGFPAEFEVEMLMNLFVFGNVYEDSSLAVKLRSIHLIQKRSENRAFRLGEAIDVVFRHIEENEHYIKGSEHSVEDFKSALKRFFGSDVPMLTVCLVDPFENTDKTIDAIKELIIKRRSSLSRLDVDFTQIQADQFECPTKNFRVDEVRRYLKAYDLKESGKIDSEIMRIIHPDHESEQWDLARMIKRDQKKARTIIANVENGFFPGKYL